MLLTSNDQQRAEFGFLQRLFRAAEAVFVQAGGSRRVLRKSTPHDAERRQRAAPVMARVDVLGALWLCGLFGRWCGLLVTARLAITALRPPARRGLLAIHCIWPFSGDVDTGARVKKTRANKGRSSALSPSKRKSSSLCAGIFGVLCLPLWRTSATSALEEGVEFFRRVADQDVAERLELLDHPGASGCPCGPKLLSFPRTQHRVVALPAPATRPNRHLPATRVEHLVGRSHAGWGVRQYLVTRSAASRRWRGLPQCAGR